VSSLIRSTTRTWLDSRMGSGGSASIW
jgi:hypothetical protein